MSERDYSETLAKLVEESIAEGGLDTFEGYWNLYEAVSAGREAQSFYISVGKSSVFHTGDASVGIISDGVLVNIWAAGGTKGGLTFRPLDSIAYITVDSQGHDSSLEVTAIASEHMTTEWSGVRGEMFDKIGFTWTAKTEDEKRYLLSFAKALLKGISNR